MLRRDALLSLLAAPFARLMPREREFHPVHVKGTPNPWGAIFVAGSRIVAAYMELAAELDALDDGDSERAEAIRSAGDVLWEAMTEGERDDVRIFSALLDEPEGVEGISTAATQDPESAGGK